MKISSLAILLSMFYSFGILVGCFISIGTKPCFAQKPKSKPSLIRGVDLRPEDIALRKSLINMQNYNRGPIYFCPQNYNPKFQFFVDPNIKPVQFLQK